MRTVSKLIKWTAFLGALALHLAFFGMVATAAAARAQGVPPDLTADQKSCLDQQSADGVRGPQAFQACGIQPPPHRGGPHLTDAQKSCLDSQKAAGADFQAAASACGLPPPPGAPNQSSTAQ